MQASTRDTLSCMDRHKPTGSHGHVSGSLAKADMVHKFRRGYDSQDPIGYLDRDRDRLAVMMAELDPSRRFDSINSL